MAEIEAALIAQRTKTLDDTVDGAWAEGKAPLYMLTQFMKHVNASEIDQALELANSILKYEPDNKIINGFIPVLLQANELGDDFEFGSESSEESEEETDDSDSDDSDEHPLESDDESLKAEAKVHPMSQQQAPVAAVAESKPE